MTVEPRKLVCGSPIGWLGGKTQLSPAIIACMAPHKCYCEVFGGSMVVFFGKPPSKIEILNDINGELVNLMKVLSGTYFDESLRQEFIEYVRNMPPAREAFEDWKKWDQDRIQKLNPAQRAFRFYYCVKKGFSCIPTGGYEASPFATSRYNMNSDFEKYAARFRATSCQLENMEFEELITKYNRAGANVMFFLDPPYYVATDKTSYYEFTFTKEDHARLKSLCDTMEPNGNKVLITYDDLPEVIDLYKGYYIYRTDPISYKSADERGERETRKTELIISNYDIVKMLQKDKTKKSRDMFDSVHTSGDRIEIPDHVSLSRI